MSQNILITGATGNLGDAVTAMAIESGYQVFGTYVGDLKGGHDAAHYTHVDLASEEETDGFIRSLRKSHDDLHAAVLLAGGFAMGNIGSTNADDLKRMYQLNFLTAYHVVRPVFKWMQETSGGRIVLVGAKPALEGGASEVLPYALSKGLVIQLAGILNEAGRSKNIVASVVVPSVIDTPANRKAMPDAKFDNWVTPQRIAGNIMHLISKEGKDLRNPILKLYGNA